MNLAVEACTVVKLLCFLQEFAADHGCGVVLWFMTSEAPLTTNSLHCTASSLKQKNTNAPCDTSGLQEPAFLCALPQHADTASSDRCVFKFVALMMN